MGVQLAAFLCFPLICFGFAAYHDQLPGYIGLISTLGLMMWTGIAYYGQSLAKVRSHEAYLQRNSARGGNRGGGLGRSSRSSTRGCRKALTMWQCWCVQPPLSLDCLRL